MDLSGQTGIVFEFEEDAGLTTITFKNSTGSVTLGTVTIETVRHRALYEGMREVAKIYSPDLDTSRLEQKLTLDVNAKTGRIEFG